MNWHLQSVDVAQVCTLTSWYSFFSQRHNFSRVDDRFKSGFLLPLAEDAVLGNLEFLCRLGRQ
jgi:hypothetical protein